MDWILKIIGAFAGLWLFALMIGLPILVLISSDEIAGSNAELAQEMEILKITVVALLSAVVGYFILKLVGFLPRKQD